MEGGIDEAGRGPVIGPMVVVGVAGDPQKLWDMGCRDSKQVSPTSRERLARLLASDPDVQVEVEILDAEDLDALMAKQTLNEIEVDAFNAICKRLKAPKIVADAADVDAARFARNIGRGVNATIEARHRADADHGCVAAASIVAKVTRDHAVATLSKRLERELGLPIGSGYPSDPITIRFLDTWVARFKDVPPGTRRAWKTSKRVLAKYQQGKLGSF